MFNDIPKLEDELKIAEDDWRNYTTLDKDGTFPKLEEKKNQITGNNSNYHLDQEIPFSHYDIFIEAMEMIQLEELY